MVIHNNNIVLYTLPSSGQWKSHLRFHSESRDADVRMYKYSAGCVYVLPVIKLFR